MRSASTLAPLRISGAGFTHKGLVRDRNEDAILIDPNGELWAVADGMGGHGHGDVAADMVIDSLATLTRTDDPEVCLVETLQRSNQAVFAAADGTVMGATVVAAFMDSNVAYCAWVGDSRIYLWRQGQLKQMTKDHSHIQELIDQGVLSKEAERSHPERNVVTRAIGAEPDVDVDTFVLPLQSADRLVLCSDGLSGAVEDTRLANTMMMNRPDNATAARLLQAALDAGAPDNVSVIVVTATEG
ncbi:protein phosphatase 2C domain-containing protein [uncultured Tateyamaria sp.]|uniref:PP2C family protein-serine/threonine phosphatase n=1 Tax=uncultured Tateyamaria sp. TaxID=455651 RepID=UPI002608ACA5|nr:protein phosphatase 2C domain-containing protein [uncultured Tateyamaria sp.]